MLRRPDPREGTPLPHLRRPADALRPDLGQPALPLCERDPQRAAGSGRQSPPPPAGHLPGQRLVPGRAHRPARPHRPPRAAPHRPPSLRHPRGSGGLSSACTENHPAPASAPKGRDGPPRGLRHRHGPLRPTHGRGRPGGGGLRQRGHKTHDAESSVAVYE